MITITGIGQLASCPPHGGQSKIGIIEDAAVVIEDQHICWAGKASELPQQYQHASQYDAGGKLVIPGLVDCHTHLCFGGWRGDEFELRLQGKSYQEIAAAGGGIRSTVKATRASTHDALLEKAATALDNYLSIGVTTLECKSGYGLDIENELKQLRVYQALQDQHCIDLVPTFLGAHVVPAEFIEQREQYVDLICNEMLPQVAAQNLAKFCDVYIDTGAFTLAEGEKILRTAKALGLGLKAHAEQLSYTGSAAMAAGLGAASLEHLEYLDAKDLDQIKQSQSVAVSLPIASLYLREPYLNCRQLIEHGIPVAVATDYNPGSAPSWQLHIAMTLACINQQMTPAEVLKASTSYAAKALRLEDKVGSILPGYQADLVIIDAPNVNQWLYHMQGNTCLSVMKAGQWVYKK